MTTIRFQEIPRKVEAVKFAATSYQSARPFSFENFVALLDGEPDVPEWLKEPISKGLLVPFYTPGVEFWRFNFFYDSQTLVIEPGEWLVYDKNYRRSHKPQYQILSNDAFYEAFEEIQ